MLIAALHLRSQNIHSFVLGWTKWRLTDQNRCTVTGLSIKGPQSERPYIRSNPNEHLFTSRSHSRSTQLAQESTTNSETGLANTASVNDDKIFSYSTSTVRVSRLRYMSRTNTHGDYNQANKFVLVFVPFLGSKALLFLLQHLTLSTIKKIRKEVIYWFKRIVRTVLFLGYRLICLLTSRPSHNPKPQGASHLMIDDWWWILTPPHKGLFSDNLQF